MTTDIAAARELLTWQPIETAPPYMDGNNEALLGQADAFGRWVKVTIWNPTWTRDAMKARGVTHWTPLPPPPQEPTP